MGYYTQYTLTHDGPPEIDGYITALPYRQWSDDASKHRAEEIANALNGNGDNSKWYDHEKDMLEFSREWPNVTFRLAGEGEEQGDVWVQWFRNGEVQTWRPDEIQIPENPPQAWSKPKMAGPE